MSEAEQRVQGIDVDAIVERLKASYRVETDRELATILGTSASTLAGWRHRNSIPLQVLIAQSSGMGLSMDYLLFGRGPEIRAVRGEIDTKMLRIALQATLTGGRARRWSKKGLAEMAAHYYSMINDLRDKYINWFDYSDEEAVAELEKVFTGQNVERPSDDAETDER